LPAIPSIVEQHAQEAVFLSSLRQQAVCAPHYSLRDLVKLDYRLDANLDGLRLAEDFGWKLCEGLLETEGAAGVFTSAVVAISSGNEARIQQVVGLATTTSNLSRGLAASLGWLPLAQVRPYINKFLAAGVPAIRRVGIAAAAIHREYPGPALLEAMDATDPFLKARALRAAGELGRGDLLEAAELYLDSEDEAVRFAGAWSSALRNGTPRAIRTLKAISDLGGRFSEDALEVAMRRMEFGPAKAWQQHLSQNASKLRLAIAGAGALGDPELIAWLIQQMSQPTLARVAGEAFILITGVDIVKEHLDAGPPEGFDAGPDDNPANENVASDPDENLPWPAPVLIQSWWNDHADQFQSDTRYLLGKPITEEWAAEVLRANRQRQRAAAALELAIRQPRTPLFNIKAPGFRQLEMFNEPDPAIA